jgi:hypothetical protein
MLDGVNDLPEHARELAHLVQHHAGRGVSCKLNLIPFNPFPASGLVRSPQQRVQAFAKILSDAGIVTTVRKTRGDDIDAACGQLAGDVKDRTRVDRRIAQQRTIVLKPVPRKARRRGRDMRMAMVGRRPLHGALARGRGPGIVLAVDAARGLRHAGAAAAAAPSTW